jgi:oligopeptide transport system substrate-binding protein
VVNHRLFLRRLCLFAATLIFAACGRRETLVERGNREGILLRGSHADVADVDPHTAVTITEIDVCSALFEGLTAEDPVDLHPIPGVADRWDISADGLNYTFHLRADARWSDGSPVTASDFVASWKRMLTPAFAAENATLLYALQGGEAYHKGATKNFDEVGVKAADPHTLKVTLEHPTTYFLSLLALPAYFPVPTAVIAKFGAVDMRGNRWTRPETLVSNGPFVLKTWRANQEIRADKSPTYWDAAHVRLNAIRFLPIDSTDSEERAFRAGQLHLTYVVPFEKTETYRREMPQFLRTDAYLNTYFIRVNTLHPPLDDEKLRQALSLAIDRTTLVERVLHSGQRVATSMVPPGLPNYTPPERTLTDPAEAKRLLAESAFGKTAPGRKIQLLFPSSENMRVIAEALQQMWRQSLGLDIELVNQEHKVVNAERREGHYDLVLSDWVADYLDASSFLEPWRGGSPNNHTGWSNREYDALLFAAARNPDVAQRAAQLQQAESILLKECPVLPLYFNPHTFLLQPSVHGWHPTLLDHHPYKAVWLE